MKKIISYIMFVMFMATTPLFANDIYVTQSGANLTLDILQDGQNNTIGNSTTASASTGASTSLNIDQVGNSNVIKYQINGQVMKTQIKMQSLLRLQDIVIKIQYVEILKRLLTKEKKLWKKFQRYVGIRMEIGLLSKLCKCRYNW